MKYPSWPDTRFTKTVIWTAADRDICVFHTPSSRLITRRLKSLLYIVRLTSSFDLILQSIMYEASKAPVSKDVLLRTNAVMLVLTSAFVFARAVLQIAKRKPFELPDFFVYFAYCLFIALWACYHVVTPPIYRAYAFMEGETEAYATMKNDAIAMLKFLVAGQICFYTLLISVKMSLMTLYRKLLAGLPSIYRKIWWALVAFCALVSMRSKTCPNTFANRPLGVDW